MSENTPNKSFDTLKEDWDSLKPISDKMDSALTPLDRQAWEDIMAEIKSGMLSDEKFFTPEKQKELSSRMTPIFEKMQRALTEEENEKVESLIGAFIKAGHEEHNRTQESIDRYDDAAARAREAIKKANETLARSRQPTP